MKEEALGIIRQSYDRVAGEYARRMFSELERKPLDCELLTRFADQVSGKGEICDIGCGPGHVARYLRDRGADVFGLDLSDGMLEEARRLNPDIPFRQGNMLALELPDALLAGITAFYAIVHLRYGALQEGFREMARVLKPDGLLLLSFHIGEETVHRDEWLDQPVTLDFRFFSPQAIASDLEAAGLVVQETVERDPYAPEVEHQSRRAYIFARKPAAAELI